MKRFFQITKRRLQKLLALLIFGISIVKEEIFYQGEIQFNYKSNQKTKVMKLASNNLLETLSDLEIENLTIQVKETLATNAGFIPERKPKVVFTAAQLWNIHRQRKTCFSRQNGTLARY